MLINIIEKSITNSGQIHVEVRLDDYYSYEVTLNNPNTAKTVRDLDWYFSEYIYEPYTAETKVQRVVNIINEYGKSLFNQIFQDKKAYNYYLKKLNEEGFRNIKIKIFEREVQSSSNILWEALRDPHLSEEPLVAKGIVISRAIDLGKKLLPSNIIQYSEINLLIVTARPNEENDINYRTIQKPIIENIIKSGLKVNPFILRPGTYKALVTHLREVGLGFYHIIHFDTHGQICSYDELLEDREENIITFSARFGRRDIIPYEGKQTFLFFETTNKGIAEPVTLLELGVLVRDNRIPICIFNSCQTFSEDFGSQSNILSSLFNPTIFIGFKYNVSVSAITIFFENFYKALFNSFSIVKAVTLGRIALHDDKNRQAALGYNISLEDWSLPVIYQQGELNFQLRKLTLEEEVSLFKKNVKQPIFPISRYGFFGRDLDILKLERILIQPHVNHLLLRGMIGVGKSTLLKYLESWWTITKFRNIQGVFYFNWQEKKITHAALIDELAKEIYPTDYFKEFKQQSIDFREEQVILKLNHSPYALILDNIFEFSDAVIIDFLSRIIGKSFVVFGSTTPEVALAEKTFQENVYQLEGLDKETSYELASKIIQKTTGKNFNELFNNHKLDLENLMKLLVGFPAAMELILPFLRDLSPYQLTERFKEGNLDISYDSLVQEQWNKFSNEEKAIVFHLLPFRGYINYDFSSYSFKNFLKKKLNVDGTLSIEKVVEKIINSNWVGMFNSKLVLKTEEEEKFSFLKINPAIKNFLFIEQKNAKEKNEDFFDYIQDVFVRYYHNYCEYFSLNLGLGKGLVLSESTEANTAIELLRLEYDNLKSAFQIAFKNEIFDYTNILSLLIDYTVIEKVGDFSSLAKQIEKKGHNILQTNELKESDKIILALIRFADKYKKEFKRYDEAISLYKLSIEIKEQLSQKTNINIERIYFDLADCYTHTKQYKEAEILLEKVIVIANYLQSNYLLRDAYRLFGDIKYIEHKKDESLAYFEKVLKISKLQKDVSYEAFALTQIGHINFDIEHYQNAEQNYLNAEQLYKEVGDKTSLSYVYSQLGLVKEQINDLNASKNYFQKSLELSLVTANHYREGNDYYSLGRISEKTGNYEESKDYYAKALKIFIELKDKEAISEIYKNLGSLEFRLNELESSKVYLDKAIVLKENISSSEVIEEVSSKLKGLQSKSSNSDNYNVIINKLFTLIGYSKRESILEQLKSLLQANILSHPINGLKVLSLINKDKKNGNEFYINTIYDLVEKKENLFFDLNALQKTALGENLFDIDADKNNLTYLKNLLEGMGINFSIIEKLFFKQQGISFGFLDLSLVYADKLIVGRTLSNLSLNFNHPLVSKVYSNSLHVIDSIVFINSFQILFKENLMKDSNSIELEKLFQKASSSDIQIEIEERKINITNKNTPVAIAFTANALNINKSNQISLLNPSKIEVNSILNFQTLGKKEKPNNFLIKEGKNRQIIINIENHSGYSRGKPNELILSIATNSKKGIKDIIIEVRESSFYSIVSDEEDYVKKFIPILLPSVSETISIPIKTHELGEIPLQLKINGKYYKPDIVIYSYAGNPYQFGPPVENEASFFGRKDKMKKIMDDVYGNKANRYLIGAQRSGKTSLLLQLKKRFKPPVFAIYFSFEGMPNDIEGTKYIINKILNKRIFYISTNKVANWFLRRIFKELSQHEGFKELLISKLTRNYQIKIDNYSNDDILDHLRDFIADAQKEIPGFKLCLLLDEGDRLLDVNESFSLLLRYLANQLSIDLRFIIGASNDFRDYTQVSKSSPLGNIVSYTFLEPFSEQDTRDLITVPAKRFGISYTDKAVTSIKDFVGGQPFYLQAFCSHCFDLVIEEEKKQIDIIHVNKIKKLIFSSREIRDKFKLGYWNLIKKNKKYLNVLKLILTKSTFSTEKYITILIALKERALLVENDGKYQISCQLFEIWLKENMGIDEPS